MSDYNDLVVETGFYEGVNICFDCARSGGRCPWSEVDSETGEVKFQPVEGWKTVKISRRNGRQWEIAEQIVECPLFVETRRQT